MIIRSAIIFLSVFDVICDSYDWVKKSTLRITSKEMYIESIAKTQKPTYSIS
ncbi:MAG: hypothetical protein M0P66_05180 [Salinivirgaceae bacterium]|nr:hypothetical protein [Salinivirgaceae bacterium]